MTKEWNEKMKELFAGLEQEEIENYLTEDGKQPKNDLLPGIGGAPAEETEKESASAQGTGTAPLNLITNPTPWSEQIEELLSGGAGKEAEDNFLREDGKMPQNDLLPGIGGEEPNVSRPAENETGAATENETDIAIREALKLLAERLAAGTAPTESESEGALRAEASNRLTAAEALRENATEKGNTLYDALLAFAGKQDGRYDALIEQISEKGYADFAGVSDILSSYAEQGDRAAGYAAANGAADNGGNPDSYAAAQAARQRLAFTDAGSTAALSYYNDQLDRWLSALKAAGADATDIYGLMQDNVDGTHEAATEEGKLGESLFSSLSDLQSTRTEAEADQFSSLLSHYAKLKGESGQADGVDENATSPMEIDREYERMITDTDGTGAAYSPTDALIKLWKKYPTMRDYLLEKYNTVLNPPYEFNG